MSTICLTIWIVHGNNVTKLFKQKLKSKAGMVDSAIYTINDIMMIVPARYLATIYHIPILIQITIHPLSTDGAIVI